MDAPRVPYGALGRPPDWLGDALASRRRGVSPSGRPVVAMIFHPFQLPSPAPWSRAGRVRALVRPVRSHARGAGRFTANRRRLEELHVEASERADLVFAVSTTLVDFERGAGRDAILMPSAADSFPAPDPRGRGDRGLLRDERAADRLELLREVGEAMGDELVVLFVGALNEDECPDDPDFQACRALPQFVWLGRRSNDEAARLIMTADSGSCPIAATTSTTPACPTGSSRRRGGRRTISADYDGVRVWERAIVRCRNADEWVAALRASEGARAAPDMELRDWALGQTGERQDAPLWRRLARLGVAIPPGAGVEAGPPEDRRPDVAGRADDLDAGGGRRTRRPRRDERRIEGGSGSGRQTVRTSLSTYDVHNDRLTAREAPETPEPAPLDARRSRRPR